MNKKIIGLIIVLVIIIAGGIIIHQVYGNQPEQEKEIIKIGVIAPFSGKIASWGNNAKDGLELALQKIEQDNISPNYTFELVYEDDVSNVKQSVSIFQKYTSIDQIDKIIGPIGSKNIKAVAPLTDNTDFIVITPVAGAEDVTIGHANVFRIWPIKSKQLEPMFRKIKKDGYKKIAIITTQTDSTLSARNVFVNHYKDNPNVEIVFDEKVDDEEADFKTVLLKARVAGADSLFLNLNGGQFGNALTQRVNLGIDLPTFTTQLIDSEQDINAAGSALEGVWFTAKNTAEDWFVDYFKSVYERDPEQEAATGYDALMIYALAINEVGNDNQQIRQYFNDMVDYPGAAGVWEFDENRNVPLEGSIKIMRNGKLEVIE